MKPKKLGCLTTGGLVGLIISLLAVGASFAATRSQMFSPGELNAQGSGTLINGFASHAEFGQDCAACHSAPWDAADMSDLCLQCHPNVIDQLADQSSLHGAAMLKMDDQDCRVCHTDHHGPDASMTEFLGGDFPHELVGFALQSHDRIDWSREVVCADCHQDGFLNFAVLVCVDCHEQIDSVFMAEHTTLFENACLACHDGIETFGTDFDHDLLVFPLDGKHAGLACEECHRGATTLAMLQQTPQACELCHLKDDAHQGELGKECSECHNTSGWKPALFDHSPTGFDLIGGHAEVACKDCHQDATFQGANPACISCHASDEPHEGQFGTDCLLCHTVFSWDDIHFDHSGTYAQDCLACHQSDSPANHYPGQCSACHTTSAWLPASFNHAAVGATDCLACHTSDRPANHYNGQCSTCHSTSGWLPASFNHTFPTNHGGAKAQCQLCHTSANYSSYTCYGCHEHSVSDIRSEHEGISNLDNCIRCHWDGREHDDGGGGESDEKNENNND